MSLGLFIGRLNPPHIWHIKTIEKALIENDKVIVLLGTPIFNNKDNPLSFADRKNILKSKFKDRIIILEIIDTRSDILWVYNIYKLIYENWFWIKDINLYWWDFKNDSAYLVLKKHEDKLINFNINYIENSRSESYVQYNGNDYQVSATNLRNALNDKNYDLVKKFCDKDTFEIIKSNFS